MTTTSVLTPPPHRPNLFCKMLPEGVELIKHFESFQPKPYLCPAGVWTIGYGHTRTVSQGMVWDEAKASAELVWDVRRFESKVASEVIVPLNPWQFSALVSFAFNVGTTSFERSTLLKLLNRGWFQQVPAQLRRWNKADGKILNGLTLRREAEITLWNKIIDNNHKVIDNNPEI